MPRPQTSQPEHQADVLRAGRDALTRGAWEEARVCFEAALRQAETPEALEGLGMAAWWLRDATATFEALERAYRLYRGRDDRRGAARVATWLAIDSFAFRGEHAVASGWFQRAHRLLDGLDAGAEHAMLAIWEGHVALALQHDTAQVHRLATQAAVLARSLGLIDAEMLAQALQGLALVSAGDVGEGMRLLDEATTAAVAGEMTDPDAIVTTCCYLIDACERVRDYDRAAQWCEKAMQISARWSYRLMFSYCRTRYAGVLIWRGAWPEAEAELAAATDDLAATHPVMATEGSVRLAELRRCQVRLEEAAALLEWLESRGRPVPLEQAALALDQGDAATAAELAESALRAVPPQRRLERVTGLEVLVRARAALGDHAQAAEALRTLRAISAVIPTQPLQASTHFSEGVVAVAAGDHQTARRCFEDAVDLFARSGTPYEAGRARLELASVLAALGRSDRAAREARAARESLQRIGAAGEAARADALLRQLHATGQAGSGATGGRRELTPRELGVLRLVAEGQSDREIAATLNLSEHTVHRHISNILTKLDLPSRAAAVAHAARHGLL